MTSEEATNFEKTTRFEEKLRLRTWDDQAKVAGADVEPKAGHHHARRLGEASNDH